MGRKAKISLIGLYNWDSTLFDLMELPEGLSLEVFRDNLLAETAELEVLYPNPEVMKNLIALWSRKQIDVWTRLYETTMYEYNPIENYDRIENGRSSGTDKSTHSGKDTNNGTSSGNGYEAGFDSVPSGNNDGLVKTARNENTNDNTLTYGHKIDEEHSQEHELRIHGNIGTVTAQSMISQQRNIVTYNMYDTIIREFTERFCILVY